MDKYRTCFFTGHRIIANKNIEKIKELIAQNIEELIIKHDVKNFICGGALGFDMIAAETVAKMREMYPHIKLILYLPCYGQSRNWTDKQRFRYNMIKAKADEYVYITEEEYTKECMNLRNMKMIKDSAFCIAFCMLSRSGTGLTMKNAEAVGTIIKNIADEIYEK